ncbi:MAG: GNAT family N-acetyltransferase [Pseudomonadota bacterium]
MTVVADITIRAAADADFDAVHACIVGLANHVGEIEKMRGTPETLRRHSGFFRTLVAEQSGAVVGAVMFCPVYSSFRGESGAFILDLYVSGAARQGGLGRRLLRAALVEAGAWGAAYLMLNVHANNTVAQGFYRKLGFTSDPGEEQLCLSGAALAALEEAP